MERVNLNCLLLQIPLGAGRFKVSGKKKSTKHYGKYIVHTNLDKTEKPWNILNESKIHIFKESGGLFKYILSSLYT